MESGGVCLYILRSMKECKHKKAIATDDCFSCGAEEGYCEDCKQVVGREDRGSEWEQI